MVLSISLKSEREKLFHKYFLSFPSFSTIAKLVKMILANTKYIWTCWPVFFHEHYNILLLFQFKKCLQLPTMGSVADYNNVEYTESIEY